MTLELLGRTVLLLNGAAAAAAEYQRVVTSLSDTGAVIPCRPHRHRIATNAHRRAAPLFIISPSSYYYHSTVLRPPRDNLYTLGHGPRHCGLSKYRPQRSVTAATRGYVTVTLMTFHEQSNGCRTAVESKSNRIVTTA